MPKIKTRRKYIKILFVLLVQDQKVFFPSFFLVGYKMFFLMKRFIYYIGSKNKTTKKEC